MRGPAPPMRLVDNTAHNPAFVEWMMGLPPGWVTGFGFKRNAVLRLLGNGVVPQQGAEALRRLLRMKEMT